MSDTRVDPRTFKSVDCKLVTTENISILDGDNLIIVPKPEYEEFLFKFNLLPYYFFQELVQSLLDSKNCFSKEAYDQCKNDLTVFKP